METILVTGAAGFIGYHLTERLLNKGYTVIGFDNVNDYYDPELKFGRLKELGIQKERIIENEVLVSNTNKNFKFIKASLEDSNILKYLFEHYSFSKVVNLAAQAGVRYSLENPKAYIDSNIIGFFNILEICRQYKVQHLVYASSSSVYGMNEQIPFSESQNVDHPVSLYAASKKSNELMAHTYSHLYKIPTSGLRFFTVYGPWGRPDMALFLFTKAIVEGKAIEVFNEGNLQRDFTYIDDIVEGIYKVLVNPPNETSKIHDQVLDATKTKAPYKLYNIGNGSPVKLTDFISAIEKELGMEAKKKFLTMQPGDVYKTWADCSELEKDHAYKPNTKLSEGITSFIKWYKTYYKV